MYINFKNPEELIRLTEDVKQKAFELQKAIQSLNDFEVELETEFSDNL